jgi:glycerol-3-phosphate acyltransferase PlsY
VATAGGVLLAIDWRLGLAVGIVWIATAKLARMSSVASIAASASAPFVAAWCFGIGPVLVPVTAMAVLVVARHRENIRKILAGTESRIGARSGS